MKALLVLALLVISLYVWQLNNKVEAYHQKQQVRVDTVEVYGFNKAGKLIVVATRLDTIKTLKPSQPND